MADLTIHFTFGLAAGTCILLPSVIRKLSAGRKCARETGRMLAGSYAMAVFAIIPNILRFAGLPEGFCNGWWMNLFLFNPLLDFIKPGGMLIGEIAIVLLFMAHYSIIFLALARIRIFSMKLS